jgi:hypothetical protein
MHESTLITVGISLAIDILQHVRFAGLLWLKVLFAGLLWEKNTAGWLLIPLNSSNEQGVDSLSPMGALGSMMLVLKQQPWSCNLTNGICSKYKKMLFSNKEPRARA